jgi:serine/threonine protein kinase
MTELLDRLNIALASRFTVEREVGRGGMATVFMAHDRKLDRPVALKVLLPDLAASIGAERFLREIEIAAKLTHPNILPLHDCGEADGLLYYVMPYVHGGSLRQRLNEQAQLPLDETVAIVGPVAAALAHAHRHGVVHRDVKPENILFSEGQPVVADFGIAKAVSTAGGAGLTRSGFPIGTVGYMSPEQASGRVEIDARTDVCSLACVVFETLMGGTPGVWPVPDEVRLGRFQEISAKHRERLDQLPGRIEQVLVKGLAIRPGERFATPLDFASALAVAAQPSVKLPDSEVRDIIGRAAEQQVERPTQDDAALSMGGVEQIAAQVGIAPERVRDAARAITSSSERTPSVYAAHDHPTSEFRKGRLVVERTIAGEISDSTVSTVGNSLHWAGTKPGFVGRDVRVSLTTASGRTSVHIEEHIELRGAGIFVPAWGAAGGGLLGLGVAAALGIPEGGWIAAAILPLAFGGAFLTATGIPKGLANKYRPELEELADRLEAVGREELTDGGR